MKFLSDGYAYGVVAVLITALTIAVAAMIYKDRKKGSSDDDTVTRF